MVIKFPIDETSSEKVRDITIYQKNKKKVGFIPTLFVFAFAIFVIGFIYIYNNPTLFSSASTSISQSYSQLSSKFEGLSLPSFNTDSSRSNNENINKSTANNIPNTNSNSSKKVSIDNKFNQNCSIYLYDNPYSINESNTSVTYRWDPGQDCFNLNLKLFATKATLDSDVLTSLEQYNNITLSTSKFNYILSTNDENLDLQRYSQVLLEPVLGDIKLFEPTESSAIKTINKDRYYLSKGCSKGASCEVWVYYNNIDQFENLYRSKEALIIASKSSSQFLVLKEGEQEIMIQLSDPNIITKTQNE